MQQLSITSFCQRPNASRAPAWAVHADSSSLSFAEDLFRRSSLRFRTDAAVFRIHAGSICGKNDSTQKKQKPKRRQRLNLEVAGNEENVDLSQVFQEDDDDDDDGNDDDFDDFSGQFQGDQSNNNFMSRILGVQQSSAARHGGDGIPRQLSATASSSSSFVLSVAPESIRLFNFSSDHPDEFNYSYSSSSASPLVAECLPFHRKRWGFGALHPSGDKIAVTCRSSLGVHVSSLQAFASGAFYRQEQQQTMQRHQHQHQQQHDFHDDQTALGGDENFASYYSPPERHAARAQNALTSVMWVDTADTASSSSISLVAATTSLTRSILLWDIRSPRRDAPVAEWSAQGKPKDAPMVASFSSDSDPSYPVAMSTTAIAGPGSAPAAFVCADSSLKIRMWDLRMNQQTTTTSGSAASSYSSSSLVYSPAIVGHEAHLQDTLRHALRHSLADGDTASIGTVASICRDPLQSRCVWVNTTGGFVGRIDLLHATSSSSSSESAAGAVSHAFYSNDSYRDATSAGLPAPRMSVLPASSSSSHRSRSGIDAVVACPRFSTRSVCVMVATDMIVENGDGGNYGQQNQKRRSVFGCSVPQRQQRQFLLRNSEERERHHHHHNNDSVEESIPLHSVLMNRGGCDEMLMIEDQFRQLWYKKLLV